MCIRDRQIIESVNEKFDIQINNLDDKISKVNETIIETVQNQMVMAKQRIRE